MRILFALVLGLFAECLADTAIVGGLGLNQNSNCDFPSFVLAESFNVGNSSATPVQMPVNFQGAILDVAIDPTRGTVVYVGQSNSNFPIIFVGSILNSEVTAIALPPNTDMGILYSVAIDSHGTAVIGGQDTVTNMPLIFRLPYQAASAVQISLPGTDQGIIYSVAIGPDNLAILAGGDYITGTALIYVLSSKANIPSIVSLPDSTIMGVINSVAVGPGGRAFLGGQNFNPPNYQALIYTLFPKNLAAEAVSIPDSNDGGQIFDVAISSEGEAILVGSASVSSENPLIYRIPPAGSSASIIANANGDSGYLSAVAISHDGTAIMGGEDDTTNTPLIYRLASGASQASSIPPPNSDHGEINAVAIGSDNVAVLVGEHFDGGTAPLIWTLSTKGNTVNSISAPNPFFHVAFYTVAIFDQDGRYDVRRMRPIYYQELNDTKNQLKQAGVL